MSPFRFFQVNTRAFSACLVAGLVMTAVAGTLALGVGQARLRESYGAHLSQMADQAAATIDTFVFRRIIDASILARVPEIRRAAAEAGDQAFDADVTRDTDRRWETRQPLPPIASNVLTNSTSAFLAEVVLGDPIYREILVADRFGRLAASSGRTTDYLQSDENWWLQSMGEPPGGRLFAGDVHWDASARAYAIEIVVPITSAAGGPAIGALKVVADVREIGAVIGGIRLGTTGDAVLLRRDGSIVFSPRRADPNAQFFAADLLRERLSAQAQGQALGPAHFGARDGDGDSRLIGVATCQVRSSYPQLDWIVAVSQSEVELFAAVREQRLSLALVLALTALTVIIFALWFSARLARPAAAEDLHLVEHPRVHTIDELREERETLS